MSLFGLRKRKIVVLNSLLIITFLAIFYFGMPNINIPLKGIFLYSEESLPSTSSTSPSVTSSSSPSETSSSLETILPSTSSVSSLKPDRKEHRQVPIDRSIDRPIGDRFHITSNTAFLVYNNRLGYWKRAFKIIKDYPIFGCGLNTYALVEGRYNIGWGGYPHNSYFQMAAETGLVGITAFLWMLFVLFRESLRALRKIKNQENKMLLFGFLTGLLGFLIHSFFDTNLYSVQLSSLLWLTMGVVVTLQKIEKA